MDKEKQVNQLDKGTKRLLIFCVILLGLIILAAMLINKSSNDFDKMVNETVINESNDSIEINYSVEEVLSMDAAQVYDEFGILRN